MRYLALLLLVFSTAAVAGPKFTAYYGKDPVYEGQGGAMETVAGVDFWSDGSPPRRFKLLGYISDRRHKTGLIGKMRMSKLQKDLAKVAREHGGDAVILVDARADTIGFAHSGTATVNGSQAWGSGFSAGIQKQETKVAVIKYLPPLPEPATTDQVQDGQQ